MISIFIISYLGKTEANLDYKVTTVGKIYEDGLNIHYLDVGEGDSIFIEFPNDETMLIDSGEYTYQKKVENYIKTLGYSKIDYIIATHPHIDHIGGMAYIINNFDIGKIYMPNVSTTTSTYEKLLKTIKNKGLVITRGVFGVSILNTDDLKIEILAPLDKAYEDLNNYSIVIKITYKERKFLFMGDAEEISESEITKDVSCDVIKVGHHGSSTSSSQSFIGKTHAKYAIISLGVNNDYGHPHKEVLKRLEAAHVKIYRTDLSGNIIISTDGVNLDITEGGKNESNN